MIEFDKIDIYLVLIRESDKELKFALSAESFFQYEFSNSKCLAKA